MACNRERATSPRTRRGGRFAAFTLLASVGLVTADPAFATICDRRDRARGQSHSDGLQSGIEGRIALPESAGLASHSLGQILNWFGVLSSYGGCGLDCGFQVGNILGTIGGPSGPNQTTTGWRPYIEEYTPDGSHFAIYYGLLPSASTFYNVYNTGIRDSRGYSLYRAYFNNAVGSGNVLIGEAWYPNARPVVFAQFEASNFGASGLPCPQILRQEYGTHGLGTYIDQSSKIQVARPLIWSPWENIQTSDVDANGLSAPYHRGWFINYSAFSVSGS